MKRRLLIFIGGTDEQNGDYSAVHRMASRGGTTKWSGLKDSRPGDRVLIYIRRPHSSLVAKAEVLAEAVKGKPGDWPYLVKIGGFELLPNRTGIDELKKEFPRWAWLRYPRGKAIVPAEYADRLWRLVHTKQRASLNNLQQLPARVLARVASVNPDAMAQDGEKVAVFQRCGSNRCSHIGGAERIGPMTGTQCPRRHRRRFARLRSATLTLMGIVRPSDHLSWRPEPENIISTGNNVHILEERFGGLVSSGRVGAFPIPSVELIARKDRLIGLALRLNFWGLLARAQPEIGASLMLAHLRTEPQLTISPRCRDGDLGGFGGRALRENVMVDDAKQDPLGAGSGNQSYPAATLCHVGTFKARSFSPIGRVVSSMHGGKGHWSDR
jgi:hypothetical protein